MQDESGAVAAHTRVLFLFVVLLPAAVFAAPAAADDERQLSALRYSMESANCGAGARRRADLFEKRLMEWREIRDDQEQDMLRQVNQFFYRQIRFIRDERVWSTEDYWASLSETLCVGDGDSEDFSIGKYFALAMVGVPEDRLRQVYAYGRWSGPIVVLLYETAAGDTKVLHHKGIWDLEEVITDKLLEPRYAFNSRSYWLVGPDWGFTPVGDPTNLRQWHRILTRMDWTGGNEH